MEKFGLFYLHLKYIMAIWYILWPFDNVVAIWYIFSRFGIFCQEKSGNPVLPVALLDLFAVSDNMRALAVTAHIMTDYIQQHHACMYVCMRYCEK
jgi:hypothetical protein